MKEVNNKMKNKLKEMKKMGAENSFIDQNLCYARCG